jgi:hypothetical protein
MTEGMMVFLIPITGIVMGLMIPILYQVLDYRRRRDVIEAHHRERMAAIERGMDIPPLPESWLGPARQRKPRYLLTGMIWLFLGIALFVFLRGIVRPEPAVAYVGLIPGGIGLAFLLYYFIEGRHEKLEPPSVRSDVVRSRN